MTIPSIFSMRVIESKDRKPLYFVHDDMSKCFDADNQKWMDEVPPTLSRLASRPTTVDDIFPMVLHDMFADDEFQLLRDKGLVTPEIDTLRDKLKNLRNMKPLLTALSQGAELTEPDTIKDGSDQPKVIQPMVIENLIEEINNDVRDGIQDTPPVNTLSLEPTAFDQMMSDARKDEFIDKFMRALSNPDVVTTLKSIMGG